MYSSTKFRTPKDSVEYLSDADLDDQLMKLTKEKEKVKSLPSLLSPSFLTYSYYSFNRFIQKSP